MSGTLRFSNDGPEFPGDFVDSLLSGEVIFLCGTGMSAPQMPGFQCLVERTYETLGVEKSDSESCAFSQGRYEEVLGSLSRRLADSDAVTRTVSELLAVPDDPKLDQHRTILRLSRDRDNRISVVTTNFDTLLEHAVRKFMPDSTPREISVAGQALPAPGSASFSGIIHMHGRLRDAALEVAPAPLVLTSADYGDAYLRSGWVSRFLFDLARCKTIALVGYSANDAPIRYFLNVVEADRARFPDLKPVYAFDAYATDSEEAAVAWGTLAVTPLPYCKINPCNGDHDHSPLWRDLSELADIADHPKSSRQSRARRILRQPATDADVHARRELTWLFGGHHGLWPVVLDTVADPGWFAVLQDEDLWSAEDAAWVIARWVAEDFQHRARFKCALDWQRDLGRPFTDSIEQQLRSANVLNEAWTRVWRLFCNVEVARGRVYYEAKRRLSSHVVLDSDLRNAVRLLAPTVLLSGHQTQVPNGSESQPIRRVSDIIRPRMVISDRYGADELVGSLRELPDRVGRILDHATAELQSALELESELDLIMQEYDHNDFAIPSIEPHAQNRNRQGVVFLIRVMVDVLAHAADLNRDRTRCVVFGWKNLPGRTGLRLLLHAMRNDTLFDADEAMETLLAASETDFWRIGREIALLLKDRADQATREMALRVEERIIGTGDGYYATYPIGPGEVDWRPHARDTRVWIRLKMLRQAEALSADGAAELSAIRQRRDYLDREVEERDFFGSYISEPRRIEGDPAPIVEVAEGDRLRVARELTTSPVFDLRHGWPAFCRSDPQGAYDSLSKGELTPENGALWDVFLQGLVLGDDTSKTVREGLAVLALRRLSDVTTVSLCPMVIGLVQLLRIGPREQIEDVDCWIERLWELVSKQPKETLDLSADLYEKAQSSAVGIVVETLLLEIDARRRAGLEPSDRQLQLIKRVSVLEGVNGQRGRSILVNDLAFVLAIDRPTAVDVLDERLRSTCAEGVALRAVLVCNGSITPEVTRVFGQAVATGVVESDPETSDADTIASNILRPALAEIRGDDTVRWGLTALDVAQILRTAPLPIRIGALSVIGRWIIGVDGCGEDEWRLTYSQFFERLWPKEHALQDVSLTNEFIALAVAAGRAFPEAFVQLRPYMVPFEGGLGSLQSIVSSEVPERFPRETLDLLWLVCGPNNLGTFYEISGIIDRLVETLPVLKVDRRLQWLESRAERFD